MLSSFSKVSSNFLPSMSLFARSFADAVKTEEEKLLSGEIYDSTDPVLVAQRNRARLLVDEYNATKATEPEKRKIILNTIFGKEVDVFIEPPFRIDYGIHTTIGEGSYMNFGCTIVDSAKVEIGKKVLFAPHVVIAAATHTTDPEPRWNGVEYALPVKIGDNVWLGAGVIVGPGVTIGENSVIGAGSVVVKDIPANCVAVGNPARVIKKMTPKKFK